MGARRTCNAKVAGSIPAGSTKYKRETKMTVSILDTRVLVLNRSYYPIGLCPVRDSFKLIVEGVADILDGNLNPFDYKTWSELDVEDGMDSIGLVSKRIRVPRVIRLTSFNRVPDKVIKFTRKNVFIRDQHICQYCSDMCTHSRLSLDHVIPKSRGGKTNWANIVTSCIRCNAKKANKTPEEAKMHLHKKPARPHWRDLELNTKHIYKEWEIFLQKV